MKVQQGDIYWIDLGEPKGSEPGYRRPFVIVQNDVFNQSRLKTVVVCALTSNLRLSESPGNVFIKKGIANLPKDSVVNITQLITVDEMDFEDKIGTLPFSLIHKIIDGLNLLLNPVDDFNV